jgi:hypothetical protein
MDDKHSHIEDWLKAAAAQSPASEGGELKRQAWSKMAALLDEEDAAKPQPRLFRIRLNWAAILIPFIATAAVFAATVWVAPHFSKKTTSAGKSSNSKEHHPHKNRQTQETLNDNNILIDTALININSSIPQPMPADSITAVAGAPAGTTPEAGGIPSEIAPALPLAENKRGSTSNDATNATAAADKTRSANAAGTDNAHSATGSTSSPVIGPTNAHVNNKAAGNSPGATGAKAHNANAVAARNNKLSGAGAKDKGKIKDNGNITAAAGNTSSTANKHKQDIPHNKVNKTIIPGTVNDNEPLVSEQTPMGKRLSSGKSGSTVARDAGTAMLFPVRTKNVFALQLPSLSDENRAARVPASLSSSGGGLSLGAADNRWGLQLGLLSPLSSALGLRIGVLYIYPLGNNWFLQPQVSASYLTGYDKPFTHVAISKQHSDTSGGGSQDNYDMDTTHTPYTFKRAFAGSASINVGYHKNKLAVSTGLVYSMAMASGKKDSSRVSSGVIRDTTGAAPFIDPAFSPGRLPGKNQLSWNLDLSWYVTPHLQAGFNYRVVLWRSAGDKGFQAPLQRIQDNSLLELYIRIPIGKK